MFFEKLAYVFEYFFDAFLICAFLSVVVLRELAVAVHIDFPQRHCHIARLHHALELNTIVPVVKVKS